MLTKVAFCGQANTWALFLLGRCQEDDGGGLVAQLQNERVRIVSKTPADGAVIPGLCFGCCWQRGWRTGQERAWGEGRMVRSCFVSTPGPFGVTPCGERDCLLLQNIPAAIQCCRRDLVPLHIPWLWGVVEKCCQCQCPSLAVGAELVQPALALPLAWLFYFPVAGRCPLTGIMIHFLWKNPTLLFYVCPSVILVASAANLDLAFNFPKGASVGCCWLPVQRNTVLLVDDALETF